MSSTDGVCRHCEKIDEGVVRGNHGCEWKPFSRSLRYGSNLELIVNDLYRIMTIAYQETLSKIMSLKTDTSEFPPSIASELRRSGKLVFIGTDLVEWFSNPFPRRRSMVHTVWVDLHTGPASIPSFFFNISTTHTPVTFSSLSIVCCIGAGPRYAGSNEGCTLSLRMGWNSLSCAPVNIRPNDAVTSK